MIALLQAGQLGPQMEDTNLQLPAKSVRLINVRTQH